MLADAHISQLGLPVQRLEFLRCLLSNIGIFFRGMGRTWQIFGRICLPCGRNLSSVDIAKCDPEFFKLEKTLKIGKNIKDAVVLGWGRQILENSSLGCYEN